MFHNKAQSRANPRWPPDRTHPDLAATAALSSEVGFIVAISMSMPILIVDDYNTMIRILRNLLRQLGFSNIDEASDGRTALAKMRAKTYALVISDTDMAPMNGLELLSRVRADERTKDTPFVMVANDSGEQTDACGGAPYITKPFNAQALKTKLVGVLGAF